MYLNLNLILNNKYKRAYFNKEEKRREAGLFLCMRKQVKGATKSLTVRLCLLNSPINSIQFYSIYTLYSTL